MSKIDKLSISGVRSFSPNHKEVIQFGSPLTLIVGYNGSGKTTIIECLKYATTGEMPPNSKGGAFVHDPKLAGEKEVLAQVKLSFKSATGVPHVVTRSMQLTMQRTKRTFKTLEGSLVQTANGERSQVSLRNVKLDELVPYTLGVSSAVLDSVIFCHQDESLWPLSEPAALKKRFDEIFQAEKWTKAINALKTMRKKHGEDLAKLRIREQQDKQNKEKATRCEKRSRMLQAEIEASREKADTMTDEMHEAQQQAKEKHELANASLSISNEIVNKREQLEYRETLVAELKETLDELPGDDEQLEQSLDQYNQRMDGLESDIESARAQLADLDDYLTKTRTDHSAQLAEQGRHKSDQDKHERDLQKRAAIIRQAATRHGIRGFDGDLTEAKVHAFREKLQKQLADSRRGLERLQAQNAREVDDAADAMTALEGRKAARVQDGLFAKQRSGAIEKRTAILQADLAKLGVVEGAKAVLDHEYQDITQRLQRAQAEFEKAGWDGRIQVESEALWQLESQNDKLTKELVEYTHLATGRAQLDYRKKEHSDKMAKLDAFVKTWKPELDRVLEDWEPETVEERYQVVATGQSNKVSEARKRRDQAQAAHQQASMRLESVRESLRSRTADAEKNRDKVVATLAEVQGAGGAEVDDYLEEVSATESELQSLREDLSLFDALADYYSKCQKYLKSKSRCLLCEHAFDAKEEQARKRLDKKIEKQLDPQKKAQVQADHDQAAARHRKLMDVRIDYDALVRISAEVPALQQECKTLEAEFETTERELEDHDAAVGAEEVAQTQVEALNKTVVTLGQMCKDRADAARQMDRIASQQQQSPLATGSHTADEIQDLQAKCSEQVRVLKAKLARLMAERQSMKDQISGLELERSELNNKVSGTARDLERKKELQASIQTLREDMAAQRDAMQRTDEEIEAVEAEMDAARELRDEVTRRCRAREQAVVDERDDLIQLGKDLNSAESDIADYVRLGGPANLAANRRVVETLQDTVSSTEAEMKTAVARIDRLRDEIDSGDRTRRNVSENLSYRKSMRMLSTLSAEIAELEQRSEGDNYGRIKDEARELDKRATRLLADISTIVGSMRTQDEELQHLLEEWEHDYHDAARRFRESHIRVEATKAAIEDLGQYSSALDKAIMQYHALKMEEINRIAGELWQATYQGTDIDTILLRSDAEGATTGRRTYNYRLCMVKQDTEMDMRGRCSAGQKVLASIIVRLALAESFGVNCGLIALDEPTTNLDSDNIKSLAESLHSIIGARRAQANLQLIVITHDEEFLRHMRCSDFCDGFFRVRRDGRQNSVIEKESIARVM